MASLREHEMGDGGGGVAAVLSSHAQIAQIMSLSTPPPERVRCTQAGQATGRCSRNRVLGHDKETWHYTQGRPLSHNIMCCYVCFLKFLSTIGLEKRAMEQIKNASQLSERPRVCT